MGEVWKATITDSFNKFLGKVLTLLANLLAMVTILIIGFLIAWIVKLLLLRFLKAIQFDKMSDRWGFSHILSKGGMIYSPAHLLSRFFYWVIVLAHGQGYDLVERPAIRDDEPMKLKARMNITVQPIIGSERIWVWVCDNYLITESGCEPLHKTPQQIFCIDH